MQRRRLLRATLLGAAWWCGAGHTPYRQWRVYRQKHLLIGSSRADPASYDLARQVAGVLVRELPDSRARSSRAPDQRRIASLLASDQWQVAVLLRDDALDLARGSGMFEPVGPVPLSVLFAMDEHLLVSRPDFPGRHAWLVVQVLAEHANEMAGARPLDGPVDIIPLHPGALAHARGEEPPPS